jgi:uncharacterized membrane protein YdbT with pleckstrin-like domain
VGALSGPAASPIEEDVWQGAPDPVLSPVSARTVTYRITTQRLLIEHGIVGKSVEQIPLFRVQDVQVKQSLAARARGVGTIIVTTTDPKVPRIQLEHIQHAADIADTLGRLVLDARRRANVLAFEQ